MAKEFFKKLALGVAISLTSVAVLAGFSRLGAWLRPDEEVIECTHVGTIKLTGFAPTCTEDGLTDGILCATCQGVIKKQEPIKALGHVYSSMPAFVPTCVDGSIDGKWCERCNDILENPIYIPAVQGHTDDNADGICDGCGDSFAEGQFILSKIAYSDNVVETDVENGAVYPVGSVLRVYTTDIALTRWGFMDNDVLHDIQLPYSSNLVWGSSDYIENGSGRISGEFYARHGDGYVDFYIGKIQILSSGGYLFAEVNENTPFSVYHITGPQKISDYKIITINE